MANDTYAFTFQVSRRDLLLGVAASVWGSLVAIGFAVVALFVGAGTNAVAYLGLGVGVLVAAIVVQREVSSAAWELKLGEAGCYFRAVGQQGFTPWAQITQVKAASNHVQVNFRTADKRDRRVRIRMADESALFRLRAFVKERHLRASAVHPAT